MADIRHLPRAPITEAVIDLRVETPPGTTVEALLHALERRNYFGYMKKGAIVRGEFGFAFSVQEGPKPVTAGRATSIGVRLHSPDERYVAQLSMEGFTLSRLQPYESWEDLVREAARLWGGYLDSLPTDRVVRAATRYINNLRLPPTESLGRFLKLPPALPEGLPEVLSAFLQRFVIHDPASEATVILTQALEAGSPERNLPFILDIDVFRVATFSPRGTQVWDCLEQLRLLKNRVFFGCLTELAVELYL
jgi:uncharacterized protein (TIGR04255 family)